MSYSVVTSCMGTWFLQHGANNLDFIIQAVCKVVGEQFGALIPWQCSYVPMMQHLVCDVAEFCLVPYIRQFFLVVGDEVGVEHK